MPVSYTHLDVYKRQIMTVNADDAVTDFPPFKHFLFLYKHLSDDGKTLMVIPVSYTHLDVYKRQL